MLRKQLVQPLSAFVHVPAHLPEPAQTRGRLHPNFQTSRGCLFPARVSHAVRICCTRAINSPPESRTQVIEIGFEQIQPFALLGSTQLDLCALCKVQIIFCMQTPDALRLTAICQA